MSTDRNRHAIAVFDKLAQLYQSKYNDVSLYAKGLGLFCAALPQQADVLELACGPGNITRYLLGKRPDLKILATDLSVNMLELARAANPGTHFELMDCSDLSEVKNVYSGVVFGFGLPYLSKSEAIQWIEHLPRILHKDGAVYMSTMEGDHTKSGIETASSGDRVYMNYHEKSYLTDALAANGFSTIFSEQLQYERYDALVTDLILIAQKN